MAILYPLENVRTRLQVQTEQHKRLTIPPSLSSTPSPSPSTAPTPSLPSSHDDALPPLYHSTYDCITRVIRTEGVSSLYTGLSSALVGVGVSSAVYFFWYHLMRSHMLRWRGGKGGLPALDNLLIASLAGALNILCTLPIWVVNTRMTLRGEGGRGE